MTPTALARKFAGEQSKSIICNCVEDFDVTLLRSIPVTILLERRAVLGSKRAYE
jgi:hypothetical protein